MTVLAFIAGAILATAVLYGMALYGDRHRTLSADELRRRLHLDDTDEAGA